VSNSIFAVGIASGVDFFVDENSAYLSKSASQIFVRRAGLFQGVGQDAAGVQTTGFCRFCFPLLYFS